MSQDQLSNARWGFLELRKLYTLRLGCDASAAWVIWEPTVGPSLVLPPLLLWQAALATSGYAGADACRNCHRAEFDAQSRSAHARSLAHSQPPQPGDWAFGAGEQAITFVRRLNSEYYLEEGETWYRALAGFARTPGHVSSGGVRDRIFDPSATILALLRMPFHGTTAYRCHGKHCAWANWASGAKCAMAPPPAMPRAGPVPSAKSRSYAGRRTESHFAASATACRLEPRTRRICETHGTCGTSLPCWLQAPVSGKARAGYPASPATLRTLPWNGTWQPTIRFAAVAI